LYIWFACPEGQTSVEFTLTLLEETGVCLAPGKMFGEQGEGWVRLSLCVPQARLQEAMERLKGWWR
jgi:LL-diaminopimelate aminotransferase